MLIILYDLEISNRYFSQNMRLKMNINLNAIALNKTKGV